MSNRLGIAVGFAVAASLAFTACSSGGTDAGSASAVDAGPEGGDAWQQIVTKAKAEGTVTLYSSQNTAQLDDLATAFEDTYGIKVSVVREVDANLQTKVDAELTSGKVTADVVAQTGLAWTQDKGAADYFVEPQGPAFDVPAFDRAANFVDKYSFATAAAIVAYGWNTDRLPAGLGGIENLLNPDLAGGKIGIQEPVSASQIDFYLYLEANYGPNFLERLAAQKPRVYAGLLPISQALTSGEIAAGFTQSMVDEKNNGAPVDSGVPELVWGARFNGSILSKAPHPAAAQLLANFLVTPTGQTAFARKTAAVLPDIEGAVTTVSNVAPQDLSKIGPEAVDAYRARWGSMFR